MPRSIDADAACHGRGTSPRAEVALRSACAFVMPRYFTKIVELLRVPLAVRRQREAGIGARQDRHAGAVRARQHLARGVELGLAGCAASVLERLVGRLREIDVVAQEGERRRDRALVRRAPPSSPSSSMYDAWKIRSTPARAEYRIASRPRAWTIALRPSRWISSTMALGLALA